MRRILKIQTKLHSQVNYYDVLGVQRNAQIPEIQQAFKQQLHKYKFKLDSQQQDKDNGQKIQELFKAFGILSLEKEKLDYDSKLDLPQVDAMALTELQDKEYVNMIEEKKRKQRQEMNVNKFDRYNGGYPNYLSLYRGKALKKPGEFRDIQQEHNRFDDQSIVDLKITKADSEEFYVYQKFDQYAYEQPRSWLKLEVNHEFSNLKNYRTFFFAMTVMLLGLIGSFLDNPNKTREKYIKKKQKQYQDQPNNTQK